MLPRNAIRCCSYRGDIVNGLEFTEVARRNDPYRMLSAYHQSAQASGLRVAGLYAAQPFGAVEPCGAAVPGCIQPSAVVVASTRWF